MNAATVPLPRWERPGALTFVLGACAIAFVIWSLSSVGLSLERMERGIPALFSIFQRMFPPDLERLPQILWSLLTTFQMALVGCLFGLILSFPIAILATHGLSPHPALRVAARGVIAVFRTVPDLVWALLFVIAVGLGPAAGVMAILVDKIGFAGRFFAEAMEEADKGPQDALATIGASRLDLIFSSVVPQALPSFVATALFSLEKAVRGSVILGLVGAGGIGVELKVAFDLFDYDTACTIILCVLALVLVVEQFSNAVRRRLI